MTPNRGHRLALLVAVACAAAACGAESPGATDPDLSSLPPPSFRGVSLGLGVEPLTRVEFMGLAGTALGGGIQSLYEGTATYEVLKSGGGKKPLTRQTRLALFEDGWAIWSSYDELPGEPIRGLRTRAKWSKHPEGYVLEVERLSGAWDLRIPFEMSDERVVLRHGSIGGRRPGAPNVEREVELARVR